MNEHNKLLHLNEQNHIVNLSFSYNQHEKSCQTCMGDIKENKLNIIWFIT